MPTWWLGSGTRKTVFFSLSPSCVKCVFFFFFKFFWARLPKQVSPSIFRSWGFSGEAKYFFASSLLPWTCSCSGRGGVSGSRVLQACCWSGAHVARSSCAHWQVSWCLHFFCWWTRSGCGFPGPGRCCASVRWRAQCGWGLCWLRGFWGSCRLCCLWFAEAGADHQDGSEVCAEHPAWFSVPELCWRLRYQQARPWRWYCGRARLLFRDWTWWESLSIAWGNWGCLPLSGDSLHEFTWFIFESVITCTRDLLCAASATLSDPHSAPLALPAVIDAHADDSLMRGASNAGVFCREGPTGTRMVKGGVSGPAEDLRPVSEVEAGVNFWPAGCVRGQVAGSLTRKATRHRYQAGLVVVRWLPFPPPGGFWYPILVSPGRGKGHQASDGLDEGCAVPRCRGSGCQRVTPELESYPPILNTFGWNGGSGGSYETAWVTPGHDCLCSYACGRGAAVRPQIWDSMFDGVISLWSRVALLLSPWCARGNVPTGVNSEPVLRFKFHAPLGTAITNPCSAYRIISLSIKVSLELRPFCGVPGLSRAVRCPLSDSAGRTTVTFWSWMVWRDRSMNTALSLGCRVLGVNLTFRWVTQHIASCPLAGAVYCALPSCVRGSAELGPLGWGKGKPLELLLGNGPPFVNLGVFLSLVSRTWLDIRGTQAALVVGVHPSQWCTPIRGGLLAGLGAGVGDCRGGAVSQNVAPRLSRGSFFFFGLNHVPLVGIWESLRTFCWINKKLRGSPLLAMMM